MKTFLLIILTFSFNLIYSQTLKPISIYLEPAWEQGSSVSYKIRHENKLSTEGIQRSNTLTSKNVDIEVTNNNKKELELRWKYGAIDYVDSLGKSDPLTLLMNTLQENLIISYKLNKSNGEIEILNFVQIRNHIDDRITETIDSLKADGTLTEEHIKEITFKLNLMFSSEEQIKIIVLNDFFEFHRLYGKKYSTHQAQKILEDNFGQPESDHYLMLITDVNNKQKDLVIQGVLKSPFAEKMGWNRNVSKQYNFSTTDYWLLIHKTEMTFNSENGTKSIYEIRRIK